VENRHRRLTQKGRDDVGVDIELAVLLAMSLELADGNPLVAPRTDDLQGTDVGALHRLRV